jgi:hypothetical protein
MGSRFMSCKGIQTLCVAALSICIWASSSGAEEALEHKVERGDTLWSISERYFGTPDVWPRLWEMNPFVTNPHLLRPGDMIRVGVQTPAVAAMPAPPAQQVQPPEEVPEAPIMTGIPVGDITQLNGRGLLSHQEERPSGIVQASESKKLLLSKGDMVFINFAWRDEPRVGDEFVIYRRLSMVRHAVTGEDVGPLYSARAKVAVKERSIRSIYHAVIQESYTDVRMDDFALPFTPLPSCMKPLPSDPALRGVVVAGEHGKILFGRGSVVYLDCGRDKGLLPGTMLELVRFRNVPDPAIPTKPAALFYELFKVNSFKALLDKIYRESMVYEKMVGRMIVLDPGPRTAAALVLSTNEDLGVGTFFRGCSSWSDTAGSPPLAPSCSAQQ